MTGIEHKADSAVKNWNNLLQSRYIGGRRIRFLDRGNGPTIVLLHGIPTHSYLWRDVVNHLQFEFRMIAPDLPGFGFSDKPGRADLSPAGLAESISDFLDALGIEEFGLVSHDYGALVACELLKRRPNQVSSFTVTNTSLCREDWSGSSWLNPLRLLQIPGVGRAALAAAKPFMLKQAFRFYVNDRSRLTRETMALYWYPFTIGFKATLLQLYRSVHLEESDFASWRQAIHRYSGPAQVVWGLQDPTFTEASGRLVASLMHDSAFTGLAHSNHFVPEDQPGSLSQLVVKLARFTNSPS